MSVAPCRSRRHRVSHPQREARGAVPAIQRKAMSVAHGCGAMSSMARSDTASGVLAS